jgi:NADH-quinone oxidoreductase subunit M
VAASLIFGFGVIASLWPTHSWSPIGYAAAPAAVSMLHAGVLKKLGPFLMIRLALGLVPDGVRFWMPVVAVLCVVNILYAGYCAMAQKDLKFIIGFSSVSHMGYVLLGLACLNQTGVSGAVLLMFSHGVMAALTFALIGFIYDQTHTRMVEELGGGLGSRIPFVAVCFVMAAMASSGLPGFSNFIAEIMIFWGAWKKFPLPTLAAVFGILVTAVYLLRVVRNVFFGKETVNWASLRDAEGFAQRTPFVLLLAALLIFGFFPNLLVGKINMGVKLMAEKNPSIFEVAP